VAPEELRADHQRRHAEDAARDRPVRVRAQPLLDGRLGDRRLRVGNPQPPREIGDDGRIIHVPAVAEYRIEDSSGRASIAPRGNDKSQRRQRVERVGRRHAHRHSELPRPPQHEAIGEAPLGGDLRRAGLTEVIEQPGEKHRHELELHIGQLRETRECQVGKRRDDVEYPGDFDGFTHEHQPWGQLSSCTRSRRPSVGATRGR
jgi:hypothetical protein